MTAPARNTRRRVPSTSRSPALSSAASVIGAPAVEPTKRILQRMFSRASGKQPYHSLLWKFSIDESGERQSANMLRAPRPYRIVRRGFRMWNKSKSYRWAATFLAGAVAVFAMQAQAHHRASDADVVIEWNQLAQRYVGGPPFAQTRSFAMVHVAIAD